MKITDLFKVIEGLASTKGVLVVIDKTTDLNKQIEFVPIQEFMLFMDYDYIKRDKVFVHEIKESKDNKLIVFCSYIPNAKA